MDHSGKLSSTNAGLSLHQEGYEQDIRPKFICLLCIEPGKGGNVILSRFQKTTIPLIKEGKIKFFRTSSGRWTEWSSIVEEIEQETWIRIAVSDVHRKVKVKGCDKSIEYLNDELKNNQIEVEWEKNKLIIIDNRIAFHGRKEILEGPRTLLRYCF